MWRIKTCEHCKTEFKRYGRPEQRFCSVKCASVIHLKARPTLRCEHCGGSFRNVGRQQRKRFCSVRCIALWRERVKRLNRPKSQPPRVRKAPGRIEWSIFGNERSRGIAPTPLDWKFRTRRV